METVRTFISFETPEDIKMKMIQAQHVLKKARTHVKWDPPEKFHVTIKFLGDVDGAILPSLISRIEEISDPYSAFPVAYQVVGAFPNLKNPRVIWIGCQNPEGTLLSLKTSLEEDLIPFGFELEKRPFHAHVTLGRVKGSKYLSDLTPMLEKLTFEPKNATITEIHVMKSVLKPEGSEYTVLKAIQLKS